MKLKNIAVAGTIVFTTVAVLVLGTAADAHHPEVSATAICFDNETALVDVHVVSWDTDDPTHRVNLDIEIDVLNPNIVDALAWVPVSHGQFTAANNYQFDVFLSEPLGVKQMDIRAIAIAGFGQDGSFDNAGTFRTVTVTLPTSCGTASTTTTTQNPTGVPATTTTPQNKIIERTIDTPAVPVENTPKFAG